VTSSLERSGTAAAPFVCDVIHPPPGGTGDGPADNGLVIYRLAATLAAGREVLLRHLHPPPPARSPAHAVGPPGAPAAWQAPAARTPWPTAPPSRRAAGVVLRVQVRRPRHACPWQAATVSRLVRRVESKSGEDGGEGLVWTCAHESVE
jgi:hypothetical protein